MHSDASAGGISRGRHWSLPLWVCAFVTFLGLTNVASAGTDVSVGDKVRFFNREGSTGGGEFGVAKLSAVDTELFRTFCVQHAEFMDFHPDGFIVDGISTRSIVAGGSTLTPETAFLYSMFRADALPGYDQTPNSTAHINAADALQKAIWQLEGESGGAKNDYWKLAKDAVVAGSPIGLAGWTPSIYGPSDAWVGRGFGNVRIMNLLWATNRSGFAAGTHAQDQLVLVPTPTAVTAGSMLLIGAAWISRRRGCAAG